MGMVLRDHAVGFGIVYGIVVLILIACSAIAADPVSQQLISALPVAAYVYWSLTRLILGPSPKSRAGRRAGVPAPAGLSRYQLQLRAVQNAERIHRKRLFNDEEKQVFNAAMRCIRNCHRRDLVVHGQVSLGEVIFARPDDAFRAINSKRVDFLVSDRFGNIKFVIEHRGGGSFINPEDYERNAVKHMALQRAGIPIVPTTDLAKAEDVIADAIRLYCV